MNLRLASRVYSVLLHVYPESFRRRFGNELLQTFRSEVQQLEQTHANAMRFYLQTLTDWFASVAQERISEMSQSLKSSRFWMKCAGFAGLAVVGLFFVSVNLAQAFVISAGSMENSLRVGDHVIVNKLAKQPQRGDLVVFRYPEDEHQIFVKRVIGLPGDRIHIADKQLFRNGHRLVEPYAIHNSSYNDSFRDNFPAAGNPSCVLQHGCEMLTQNIEGGDVVVPPGAMFVLGDNRDNSLDSRYWGFVPTKNLVGTPWVIYWSYDQTTGKTRWDRTFTHPDGGRDAREVTP